MYGTHRINKVNLLHNPLAQSSTSVDLQTNTSRDHQQNNRPSHPINNKKAISWNMITFYLSAQEAILSAKHNACRLGFAWKHKNAGMEFWNSVHWTDESSFEIGKRFRKPLVWRTAYARSNRDRLAPYFKSERSSVMVCISFRGRTFLLIHSGHYRRAAVEFIEQVYDIITSRIWA